jgi:hypothetical protein
MAANEKALIDGPMKQCGHVNDDHLRAGLAVLWRAYICAQDTGSNVWDLPVPVTRLYEAGMAAVDLRWMVAKGFAHHSEETTGSGDVRRSFRHGDGLFFNNRSYLILTPGGVALAERTFHADRSPNPLLSALALDAARFATKRDLIADQKTPVLKPRWDVIRRELSLAGSIVKRFRVPARNQETILAVFEEEEWVAHIHDPLPVTRNIDAPTRLHDAINRLNRCQINPLVRFHGDGKGTGIFWEFCGQPSIGALGIKDISSQF